MAQTAKRTATKATSKNGSSSKSASTRAKKSNSTTKSRASAQSGNGAVEKAGDAAHAVSDAASKAKTPLIAAGTALVGVAAGAVIRDRLGSKRSNNPLNRLRSVSLPKPAKLNLGEIDLDKIKSAAERVNAYSQQASDLATAMEKTRKKHKP